MNLNIFTVFILMYIYAILRYHIGLEYDMSYFLFVLNKAIAWFAYFLIGMTILPKVFFQKNEISRKKIGIIGFYFSLLHVIFNVFHFDSKYFPIFFEKDSFSQYGVIIICFAILSLCLFTIVFITSISNIVSKKKLKLGFLGFVIILFHPLLIGINKWFQIQNWPYFMPPITLVCFIFGIYFIYKRYFNRF